MLCPGAGYDAIVHAEGCGEATPHPHPMFLARHRREEILERPARQIAQLARNRAGLPHGERYEALEQQQVCELRRFLNYRPAPSAR